MAGFPSRNPSLFYPIQRTEKRGECRQHPRPAPDSPHQTHDLHRMLLSGFPKVALRQSGPVQRASSKHDDWLQHGTSMGVGPLHVLRGLLRHLGSRLAGLIRWLAHLLEDVIRLVR
jgi:hypothetical protein